ncbi:putative quinol monooxygenase [Halarchaeum sp. P4]|uniref:putative quinol monooxygenase n=1 Tax=Halarchaeum sp. P4 TaxID=3421639 RepID=UPI003EB8AD7D
MIVNHVHFEVDPDERETALEAVEELVEASNAEEGVIEYRAAVDIQDEHTVRVFEQYEDEAALAAHTESAHFKSFVNQLPEFLAGDVEGTRFDVESATEVEL